MYKVRIDSFEGPFDLLVYLIENAKMDIYDIKIAEITEQYLDYLKDMGELNIEIGSEFIVLAAVLIKIKSLMLLPRSGGADEEAGEELKKELVSRLSEYKAVKKIAAVLAEREEFFAAVHEKPAEDFSRYTDDPDELLKVDTDGLVKAFRLFLDKKKKLREVRERYRIAERRRDSIEERIKQMSAYIDKRFSEGGTITFSEIVSAGASKSRYDVALSFGSMLEMIKMQEIAATQDELYGEIRITKRNRVPEE